MATESYLPDPHLLRVEPSKVSDYLLNSDHPIGGAKAAFFKSVGFSVEKIEQFVDALRAHARDNKIVNVVANEFVVKTMIECSMPTPSGKTYCIRSVWGDHRDGTPPRLITALPVSP